MTALTVSQLSCLRQAFADVDSRLAEIARDLDAAQLESPFATRRADITPLHRQLVTEDVARLREAMGAALARHNIAQPPPGASATEAARESVNRAIVAAEALGPRHWHNGEALSDEGDAELNRIVSQLLDGLLRIEGHLADAGEPLAHPTAAADPATRLEALEKTIDAGRLHHLKAPLDALRARVAADDFEIAVFGRTNAGKSSLLNALLGQEILPVGSLPATAVPVRLVHGETPRGTVRFADVGPEDFPLDDPDRLAEFATERHNLHNARHVTRLALEIPAPLLAGGVTLVDMPGLEAGPPADDLSACDLGIVAIDATGDLALDELPLIDVLQREGSAVVVVLTKADLLDFKDRWAVHGFVNRMLKARGGEEWEELPVYLASTRAGSDAELCNDWIVRGVEPRLAERAALRATSLRVKLERLERRVDNAMSAQESTQEPTLPQRPAPAARDILALIDAARRQRIEPAAEAARQAAALIREVAHNAAVVWAKAGDDPTIDATLRIRTSLEAHAAGVARDATRGLLKLRAELSSALAGRGETAGIVLPRPETPPAFPAPDPWPAAILEAPPLVFLGQRWIRRCWRRALLRAGVRTLAADAMRTYFERVEDWRQRMLDALSLRATEGQ